MIVAFIDRRGLLTGLEPSELSATRMRRTFTFFVVFASFLPHHPHKGYTILGK
jgi:hypothetical protein